MKHTLSLYVSRETLKEKTVILYIILGAIAGVTLLILACRHCYYAGYSWGQWDIYDTAWQDGFNSVSEYYADNIKVAECNCDFCQEVKKVRQN